MFRLLILTGILLLFRMNILAQDNSYDHTIDILQQADGATDHKAKDVYVFNENGKYKIEFYIKRGMKVRRHGAGVVSEISFNKASYTWESDKKVSIRLFDTNSKDEFKLKVFGDRKGTGMEVDDKEFINLKN